MGDNLEDFSDMFSVPELEPDEVDRMAEAEAQANLGISFVEFREKWFRGDYRDDPRPEVTSTAFWIDQAGEMDCD